MRSSNAMVDKLTVVNLYASNRAIQLKPMAAPDKARTGMFFLSSVREDFSLLKA